MARLIRINRELTGSAYQLGNSVSFLRRSMEMATRKGLAIM